MGFIVYLKDSAGVRQVELPDTREAFCQEVNRLSASTGIVASVSPFPPQPASPARTNGRRKSEPKIKLRAR